jgi:subtilisin family serine protease
MKNLIILLFIFICASVKAVETRTKIAVIDTGVHKQMAKEKFMCENGVLDATGIKNPYDTHGHGTNIVGIIAEKINPKTHCIVSINFYVHYHSGEQSQASVNNALKMVIADPSIRYLNMSLGGEGYSSLEQSYIKRLLIRGVKVVVAAGNEGKNLDTPMYKYYPASHREVLPYPNFYVVASELPSSNKGKVVTDTYSGKNIKPKFWYSLRFSGTSQAAAQKMADILNNVVLYSTGDKNGSQKSYRSKCY